MTPRAAAVIVAAGRGERLGAALPKCLVEACGWPLFLWATRCFCGAADVEQVVVVAPEGRVGDVRRALEAADLAEAVTDVVAGGDHRTASVRAGLGRVRDDLEIVAIHDGARPLVTRDLVRRTLAAARRAGAAVACEASSDTLKRVDPRTMKVAATLDRSVVWRAGTPQAFRLELILRAYEADAADLEAATDDCMLVERLGVAPIVVPARTPNPKITTPHDLQVVEGLLAARRAPRRA